MKYVIIHDTTDYIMCVGIFDDYEKALGHLMILMDEEAQGWKENGYELVDSEDFFSLECDSGYGWIREWFHDGPDIHISDKWYVLMDLGGK